MNERYKVVGADDFFQHIEDTSLTEDKHEGAIYNIYQVTKRLNEQDKEIKMLRKELKKMWTEIMLRSPVGGWQDVIHQSKKRIGDLDE